MDHRLAAGADADQRDRHTDELLQQGLLQVVVFEFRAKAYLGRPDEKQYGFVLEAPDGVVSALHTGTNTIAAEVRLRGQGAL